MNMRLDEFKSETVSSFDMKLSAITSNKPSSSYDQPSTDLINWPLPKHRWELPVLRYPRNIVIYRYAVFGVIFIVILHVVIIINYPKLFSNYYPKYTFWAIYPFNAFTRIYIRIHFP